MNDTLDLTAGIPLRLGSARPRIHFVLQGKGGVGKSLVSTILAQYLLDRDVPLQCIDADSVNDTFAEFRHLKAEVLNLMRDGRVDSGTYDQMLARMLDSQSSFVVDFGAATFTALSHYLAESDVLEILRKQEKEVVIHTVIAGGQALRDTLIGLRSLVETAPGTGIVVWLNEYFGPIATDIAGPDGFVRKGFREFKVYEDCRSAILGIVTIEARNPDTYGRDMRAMLAQKLTFEEVRQSEHWFLVSKSRIFRIQQDLYAQLEQILG